MNQEISRSFTSSITKSSFAAMAGVLISRASGLIRTMIVNAFFGVATSLDAFNAAFRLPNCLRDLFADGALSAAFMTALIEQKHLGNQEEKRLVAIVLGFFITLTVLLACIGVFYAQSIIDLITEANFKLTGGVAIATLLFKVLVFYLPLTMINAVIMAILGVNGLSFRAMNGSVFLSVGMIIGTVLLAPLVKIVGIYAIVGLALGALLGAILQMLYQVWPLLKLDLIPMPNFNPVTWLSYTPLRKILRQMAPRALGQGAMVLALSINTYFATLLGVGFLTYVVTAVTIIQVPIGLFGVATGFVALPVLVSALANDQPLHFSKLLIEGLRTSSWLATFTTICFSLLILPFYVVLFQHGKITFLDTINNSIAICMYSTGIIMASGNKVLINTLYALNAARQIVYNAILYLAVNTLLNVYLVPRFGLIGIGLSFGIATSLDFWVNYFSIKRYCHKKKGMSSSPYQLGGHHFALKLFILNISGFVACLIGMVLIKQYWSLTSLSFWSALIYLVFGGGLLLIAFLLIVLYWGPDHLKMPLKQLIKRIW